ncbi:MAG: hypothetical protein AAB491_01415 [Patescibacteria group bacterium]
MKEDKDNLSGIIRDYLQSIINEREREKQKEILKIVEGIKINFEEFLNFISIIKGVGIEPSINEYEFFFYKQWIESAPLVYKKILEIALENNNKNATELLDYIKGMGVKFKTLTESKLCVSTSFPANCKECYFLEVCPLV